MQIPLIAANWKSNFTYKEAENWISFYKGKEFKEREIVVFPPLLFLGEVGYLIEENGLPFAVGAQDLSPFEKGPYTGEVNAAQIKDFASYVLIGHSERRRLFNETKDDILKKLEKAYKESFKVILCISKLEELEGVTENENLVIAYEPLDAIGSGNPESPDSANSFAGEIKKRLNTRVIYGGSVDQGNVSSFIKEENIEGVLVGGKSLDPQSFFEIINNAN